MNSATHALVKTTLLLDGKEPKQVLDDLSKRAEVLETKIAEALSAGDTKALKQYYKELQAVEKKTNQIKAATFEVSKVLNNLNGSSMRDLKKASAELNRELDKMAPNTKEFVAKSAELQKVKARMNEVTTAVRGVDTSHQGFFSRASSGFNKYFGIVTAGLAAFTGVVFGFRKATDTFAIFDDKVADVMKTTNLTKEEVLSLDKSLQKVDTRTAQNSLLDLAKVAGKLGLSAEKDVDGFVKAADKIGVALTEDLGGNIEESVNQIGKLVDIFGIKSEYGIEQAMLKTGSAINSLGASSTANEGYIVEFTKRLAGVAPAAKLSLENVMGLAATLDQFGQTSEVSSTVISALLPDMFKAPGEYAKIAGMSIKDFNDLLNKDSNEAFIKFLEGLKGNNGGLGEMAKKLDGLGLEGKRSISVLGVLSSNTDTLRKQQQLANVEFEKGTSLTDEFNKKNNSAQAILEKKRKALELETRALGEKLMPIMTLSTNVLSKFMRLLSASIDFYVKNAKVINGLVLTISTYVVAVKIANVVESIRNEEGLIWLAITKAKIVWEKISTAGTILAATATALFTGKLKEAKAGMQLLTQSMTKSNIFILLATAIVAVGYALYQLAQKETLAAKQAKILLDVQSEVKKGMVDEKIELQKWLTIAKDRTRSDEDRAKAIKKLNEISPEFLGNLTKENIATKEGVKLIDEYVASLERKWKVEILEKKIKEEMGKAMDIQNSRLRDNITWTDELLSAVNNLGYGQEKMAGKDLLYRATKKRSAALSDEIEIIKTLEEQYKKALKNVTASDLSGDGGGGDGDLPPGGDPDAKLAKENSYYDELKKLRAADFLDKKTKIAEDFFAEEKRIEDLAKKEKWSAEELSKWKYDAGIKLNKDIESVDAEYAQNQFDLNQQKIDDDNATKEEILNTARKTAEEEIKLAEDVAQKEKEAAWAAVDFTKEALQIVSDANKQAYDNQLKDLDRKEKKELASVKGNQEAEEKIRQKYEAIRLNEERKAFEENKRLKTAQILIEGAIESAKLWASTVYPAGVPASIIMQAIIAARVAGQVALVQSQQFATGNLDVIGASDGRKYNAQFKPKASTGYYTNPIYTGHSLFAEKEPEIYVDGPTTRNIMMNYPGIFNAIQAVRVPQYAAGNLPEKQATNNNGLNHDYGAINPNIIALFEKLSKQLDQPIKAYTVLQEMQTQEQLLTQIEDTVRR